MPEQLQNKHKYASVYQYINLPNKRHIIPVAQSLFVSNKERLEKYITQEIKRNRNQLIDSIEKQLQIYQDTQFTFKFPPSKFPAVAPGDRNKITYQQKVVAEQQDTFKDKLSQEQIQQMREKGQFQVKSSLKNVKIPYVWKVNDRLLRGRVNIVNIWENGLSWCYSLLYDAVEIVKLEVPRRVKNLGKLPVQFFTLVFGRKSFTNVYTPQYQRQVFKDFWTDIFQNELKQIKDQVGHDFLEHIYLKYQQAIYKTVKRPQGMSQSRYKQLCQQRQDKIRDHRDKKQRIDVFKQSLKNIQNNFQNDWVKIRRRILTKISSQVQALAQYKIDESQQSEIKAEKQSRKDQYIVQKFHQQKYKIYTAHIKDSLGKDKKNLGLPIVEALTTLIVIFRIISEKTRIKNDKLSKIKDKINKGIQNKYRIRSKNSKFKQNKFNQQYEPIQKQIQSQFYQKLLQDQAFKNILPDRYHSIYKKYLNLQKNTQNLIQHKKKTLTCLYIPQRIFKTTYMLLPPYQIIESSGFYYMKKQVQMTVDTTTNFWKLKLYAMRMKSWTINCGVFLLGFAWVGPFGLRCLFGVEDFKFDQYCESYTGERKYHYRRTVLGQFNKVYDGVKKSREYFESLPDRGLFGKKFSRYFNYIQCYFFRLFLVGIIGVLILYPISIIVLSLLSVVFMVTIWLWVPLVMIVCYIFNILIFQFECSSRYSGVNITKVPLISLLFRILTTLGHAVFSVLFLVVIAPVVSAVYFLYLAIQKGFRTFTDVIMIFIISKLGRTPSRDTAIARKISGPTMSRNYYFSINQEDVYILVQSYLQQAFVQKFASITRHLISQNNKKYTKIMQYVLDPFGYSNPNLQYGRDKINTNQQQLLTNFNTQTSHHFARYPNNPRNVRFTEQQIDLYFQNSIKIVKNFVERERVQEWIFDEHSVLNQDYEELARGVWAAVFGCGEEIFQGLERIDSRFRIGQMESEHNTAIMKKQIGSVMKALQGEVSLSHRKASCNPAKRTLLDKDRKLSYIEQICSIHDYNSDLQLSLDVTDPKCLLVAPRNLQDCKVYDAYTREDVRGRYPKIFEHV